MSVRHHFKDDQYNCSEASQTPITIHILKIYNADRSKMKYERKYSDKDNDNDNDKDIDWGRHHVLYFWNSNDSSIRVSS